MKRYWFHLSHTWTGKHVRVHPGVGRQDDPDDPRENVPFICVTPTIAQALVALGELRDIDVLSVWRTTGQPSKAEWVFDYPLTEEHRFYVPKDFECVGFIDTRVVVKQCRIGCLYPLDRVARALDKIRCMYGINMGLC